MGFFQKEAKAVCILILLVMLIGKLSEVIAWGLFIFWLEYNIGENSNSVDLDWNLNENLF